MKIKFVKINHLNMMYLDLALTEWNKMEQYIYRQAMELDSDQICMPQPTFMSTYLLNVLLTMQPSNTGVLKTLLSKELLDINNNGSSLQNIGVNGISYQHFNDVLLQMMTSDLL
eukprot:408565_1